MLNGLERSLEKRLPESERRFPPGSPAVAHSKPWTPSPVYGGL